MIESLPVAVFNIHIHRKQSILILIFRFTDIEGKLAEFSGFALRVAER